MTLLKQHNEVDPLHLINASAVLRVYLFLFFISQKLHIHNYNDPHFLMES